MLPDVYGLASYFLLVFIHLSILTLSNICTVFSFLGLRLATLLTDINQTLFLSYCTCDAIRTKFEICLQNSTFQALYPLTLRSSKIFLRRDIDKRVSDSKSL